MRELISTYPIPQKSLYIANELVNFEISPISGTSIKTGSVYLSGNLYISTAVTNYSSDSVSGTELSKTNNQDIRLDPYAGCHSLIEEVNTKFGGNTVERLEEYPRQVRMQMEAKAYSADLMNETDFQAALMTGDESISKYMIRSPKGGQSPRVPVSFAIKLDSGLNKSSADLPADITGVVSLSVRLAPLNKAFHGDDWASGCGYWIGDLQLHYERVPSVQQKTPIIMQTYSFVPAIVNSDNENLSSLVPAVCNSMYASFILQSEQASYTVNTLKTAKLPNVSKVTFSFSDNQTVRVSYPLESNEEIELNYKRSIDTGSTNSLSLSKQQQQNANNEGYGIGISFGQIKNLSKSKLDLNIVAGNGGPDNATKKYKAFQYFRSLVQVS